MTHTFVTRGLNARSRRARSRRSGASMVLFLAALPVIVGACGIVIDMGNLYTKRAQAQRAADASALAGVIVANDPNTGNAGVEPKVHEYARLNSYEPSAPGTSVTITPRYSDSRGTISHIKVRVAREETVFFTPVLEALLSMMGQNEAAATYSRTVSASATASKVVNLPLSTGGPFGIGNPDVSPSNQSVYGPDSYFSFGDPWSVKYLDNGAPNPRYRRTDGVPDGTHEYTMSVTPEFLARNQGKVNVQIYDADTYSPTGTNGLDEFMPVNSNIPVASRGDARNTTRYEVYKGNTLVPGASVTYGGDPKSATDTGANEKWVTPQGFELNLAGTDLGAGEYTIRVKSLSGHSENGFRLRAGPTAGAATEEVAWNRTYGDKGGTDPNAVQVPINSKNHLQMNFSRSGTVKFNLGEIQQEQAGGTIKVQHFDVDVGSESIVYTCDTLPGQTFQGTLPPEGQRNGVFSTDTITLPPDYRGGNWFAEYVAGAQDTSSWELFGSGPGSGYVRLTE